MRKIKKIQWTLYKNPHNRNCEDLEANNQRGHTNE